MDIKDIQECWSETYSAWSPFFLKAEEDLKMSLGDQWRSDLKAKLIKEDRPVLSINRIKKPLDLISGLQRENRTDIRAYPVEGGDGSTADVYSEVIKWSMRNAMAENCISKAYKDTAKIGIGWVEIYMDYNRDPVNGDIKFRHGNPFRKMIDPYTTEIDLSDCDYILRHQWMTKEKAAQLYPDKDILSLKGGGESPYFTYMRPQEGIQDRGAKINIIEKWYREYEKKIIIFDVNTLDSRIWDGPMKKLKEIQSQRPEMFQTLKIIERKFPVIKLYTTCEDTLTLYDDIAPGGLDVYPFVPIFGFFDASYNDWSWKLQGVVRALKDIQREGNKRRSQITNAMMSMPHGGWLVDKAAVDDPSSLTEAGGSTKVIEKNPNKSVEQLPQAQLPMGLIQLEEMSNRDIYEVGPNADLQGVMQEANAPGITLQLRMKQAVISLKELDDNLSSAKISMGRIMMKFINRYTPLKITRITGKPIPQNFEQLKNTSYYDCVVDEVSNSPTYRMANFASLVQLIQHGFQVPQEMMISTSNLPEELKSQWLQTIQQQNQAQSQAQQAMVQAQKEELDIKKGELAIKVRRLQLEEKELELKYKQASIQYQNDQEDREIEVYKMLEGEKNGEPNG